MNKREPNIEGGSLIVSALPVVFTLPGASWPLTSGPSDPQNHSDSGFIGGRDHQARSGIPDGAGRLIFLSAASLRAATASQLR